MDVRRNIIDSRFEKIKSRYEAAVDDEGAEFKHKALRNEDIEYLFSLIEQKDQTVGNG